MKTRPGQTSGVRSVVEISSNEIEKCSCDEAMFLRAKLQDIVARCTSDTGESLFDDLIAIVNIADSALKLQDWDGKE